jgi:hypothetical protein
MPMVRIPAAVVAAGQVPQVCGRHGEPAVTTKKFKVVSKPPAWTAVLILLGVLPYMIVVLALRKTAMASAWPWCAACVSLRKKLLGIGLGAIAVPILLTVLLIAGGSDAAGPAFGLTFIFVLVGLIVALRAGTQPITGAFTSSDGQFVEVPKAHDRFATVAANMARKRTSSAR